LGGPVYFRSNGGEHVLPDLVADLRGQIHIVLVGRIDSAKKKGSDVARLRNTFETVPDAPVSRFTLNLFGGKRGLIVNGRNLCRSMGRAQARFIGQNGKTFTSSPKPSTDCAFPSG